MRRSLQTHQSREPVQEVPGKPAPTVRERRGLTSQTLWFVLAEPTLYGFFHLPMPISALIRIITILSFTKPAAVEMMPRKDTPVIKTVSDAH